MEMELLYTIHRLSWNVMRFVTLYSQIPFVLMFKLVSLKIWRKKYILLLRVHPQKEQATNTVQFNSAKTISKLAKMHLS